jgi:hypothetical protein
MHLSTFPVALGTLFCSRCSVSTWAPATYSQVGRTCHNWPNQSFVKSILSISYLEAHLWIGSGCKIEIRPLSRPARSQSLYRLRYRASSYKNVTATVITDVLVLMCLLPVSMPHITCVDLMVYYYLPHWNWKTQKNVSTLAFSTSLVYVYTKRKLALIDIHILLYILLVSYIK